MAGDWIKMRGNLWDDPRVASIVDATDTSESMVVGGLYWLWSTADQHTEDGLMPGLTLRQIDRKTSIPGFGAALVVIGWLAETDGGVTLANFTEHNGASAKRRATDAQRKAGSRSMSANDADKVRTDHGQEAANLGAREREEIEIEKEDKGKKARAALAPPIALESVPQSLLSDYMAVRKAKKAGPLTDTAIAALQREADKAGVSLEAAIAYCCEAGWQGFNAGWYADRQGGGVRGSTSVKQSEPAWRAEQKSVIAEHFPNIAARSARPSQIIDMETQNGHAISLD